MEVFAWLFASEEELIDCDFGITLEGKIDGEYKRTGSSKVSNDPGESKLDNSR